MRTNQRVFLRLATRKSYAVINGCNNSLLVLLPEIDALGQGSFKILFWGRVEGVSVILLEWRVEGVSVILLEWRVEGVSRLRRAARRTARRAAQRWRFSEGAFGSATGLTRPFRMKAS